jgi:hypothetical protein
MTLPSGQQSAFDSDDMIKQMQVLKQTRLTQPAGVLPAWFERALKDAKIKGLHAVVALLGLKCCWL